MNYRTEIQPFFNVDISIVSSYRRKRHLEEIENAALYFKDLGFSTYPSHSQSPIKIDDEFVFFGGDIGTFENNKRRLEIGFLKLINRAKLVYVVATNGYIGRSASIELAYGLSINAPIALSQPITEFGQEVPEEIRTIIDNNQTLLPILPIKKIRELNRDGLLTSLPSKEKLPLSILNLEDKKVILSSIQSLVRDLEKSAGTIQ